MLIHPFGHRLRRRRRHFSRLRFGVVIFFSRRRASNQSRPTIGRHRRSVRRTTGPRTCRAQRRSACEVGRAPLVRFSSLPFSAFQSRRDLYSRRRPRPRDHPASTFAASGPAPFADLTAGAARPCGFRIRARRRVIASRSCRARFLAGAPGDAVLLDVGDDVRFFSIRVFDAPCKRGGRMSDRVCLRFFVVFDRSCGRHRGTR